MVDLQLLFTVHQMAQKQSPEAQYQVYKSSNMDVAAKKRFMRSQ